MDCEFEAFILKHASPGERLFKKRLLGSCATMLAAVDSKLWLKLF